MFVFVCKTLPNLRPPSDDVITNNKILHLYVLADFYLKQLTVHSCYTFDFINMYAHWNRTMMFVLLTQPLTNWSIRTQLCIHLIKFSAQIMANTDPTCGPTSAHQEMLLKVFCICRCLCRCRLQYVCSEECVGEEHWFFSSREHTHVQSSSAADQPLGWTTDP